MFSTTCRIIVFACVPERAADLVEERRHLVDEKTAQTNRLTNQLKIYFPQMLEWFEQLDTELPKRSFARTIHLFDSGRLGQSQGLDADTAWQL